MLRAKQTVLHCIVLSPTFMNLFKSVCEKRRVSSLDLWSGCWRKPVGGEAQRRRRRQRTGGCCRFVHHWTDSFRKTSGCLFFFFLELVILNQWFTSWTIKSIICYRDDSETAFWKICNSYSSTVFGKDKYHISHINVNIASGLPL